MIPCPPGSVAIDLEGAFDETAGFLADGVVIGEAGYGLRGEKIVAVVFEGKEVKS